MSTIFYLINSLPIITLLFIGIFFFKSNFIKIILFAHWYLILIIYLFQLGVPLGGIIEVFRNTLIGYASEALSYSIIGYSLLYGSLFFTIKNKKFKIKVYRVTLFVKLLLLLLFFIFSVIAYPHIYIADAPRFNLLPGSGWASFYLIFGLINIILISKQYANITNIIYYIILFSVLVGGERADTIMLLIILINLKQKYLINNGSLKLYLVENSLNLKIFIIVLIVFSLGTLIGFVRLHGFNSIDSFIFVRALYSLHTAVDVTQVYLSSIGYIKEHSYSIYPIINDIATFLPGTAYGGAGSSINYTLILNDYMKNMGGGPYYIAGLMMLGSYGLALIHISLAFFLIFLLKSKKTIYKLWFLLFMLMVLRVVWYGGVYYYKPLLLLSILFIILINYKQGKSYI